MLRRIIYFDVYIILDFLLTYRNASVLCQSECSCLHKTVTMLVFFAKSNENAYPKGRALMQMYRVVLITKRGNSLLSCSCFFVINADNIINTCIMKSLAASWPMGSILLIFLSLEIISNIRLMFCNRQQVATRMLPIHCIFFARLEIKHQPHRKRVDLAPKINYIMSITHLLKQYTITTRLRCPNG